MPRLTVTATRGKIPGSPGRRSLFFRNRSAANGGLTAYWGFEDTITGDESLDTCGIPLAAGESLVLIGEDANLHRPLYFITASGTTFLFYSAN
jgi:hypothetical protein